ncbi:hypothetical protein NPIL_292091 [Nephila pilipes]|uniref:Uncharacterized protein n=1 Tax=Nephila pilipes TaxID=299642 RepID=A0A8X6QPJ6_NEPPI|nr:hypothetical protein NPIL_292091 [Nephila pilipes]
MFIGILIYLMITEQIQKEYCIKFNKTLGDSQSKTIRKTQQSDSETCDIAGTDGTERTLSRGCTEYSGHQQH